jgi:streptogramin lyase
MKKFLVLLMALVAPIFALPGVAGAATDGSDVSLPTSTFVGDLTAGPDGNVWFSARSYGTSSGPRVVGKITPDGQVAEYPAPEGANSIATGADGNLWFTEVDGIGRITPAGSATSFKLPAGSGAPRALTAGPDGNIWFVAGRPAAVGRISPSGVVTTFPLAGEPSAITLGPGGDLWITEPEAARVARVTVAGEVTGFPLPEGSQPTSIVLGPDGNLWFSDGSQPRVGRITPSGEVTFFPVHTIDPTNEVAVGPGGLIWFTADDEIGTITTAGKVSWPSCFTDHCEYPAAAMTTGPDGRLWAATGVGSCPGYCGGGSEQGYLIYGSSSVGPFTKPSVPFGIGPRLAPVRQGRTSITIGCGEAAACKGTLRLRALVAPPGKELAARKISKVSYSLAPGEIREIKLPSPTSRWNKLRYGRAFAIVDALQDGARVAKRGFYFTPKKGGSAKQF